jgi:YVTN family beta-propeller protein
LAITPDGAFAYVADAATDIVAVIDIGTHTVTHTLPVGGYPFGVAISPDGTLAYVTSSVPSHVSVIETGTNALVTTIGVGNSPIAVAIADLGMGGDTDADGIADAVDTVAGVSSNDFNDGAGTSGSVVDRAGLALTVEDAPSPDGVRVTVGPGSGQVTLDACGFIETIAAGSETIITCGSVVLEVIEGAAQVLLDAVGSVVSVPAGVTALVASNSDGTVLIQNVAGDGMLGVTVHGEQSALGPNQSASYTVEYQFSGFFTPVDNPPVFNSAKSGSAIPVKFSLGGDQGLHVLASGFPKSQKIACDTSAPLDPVEETAAAAASGLSYDAAANQYTYVWKTDKTWAGTCRQLTLELNDSSAYAANFKFK